LQSKRRGVEPGSTRRRTPDRRPAAQTIEARL